MARLPLLLLGWLALALGIAGVFLPLVPTVPLLLLAAACFARSSPRCHSWLLSHPQLGPLIIGYLEGEGIPVRAKIIAITMLWVSVSISLYLVIARPLVQLVLVAVAAAVSVYLVRLPNRSAE